MLQRLTEPSTYAGLAAIMVALGLSAELSSALVAVLASVAGLAAMFLSEGGKKK